MTKIIIGIVVFVVVIGGFMVFSGKEEVSAPVVQEQSQDNAGSVQENTNPQEYTVTYTSNGYAPKEVTIAQGDTVVFVNDSSVEMWPATAIHPTHTIYPGSDILQCGSAQAESMFDSCGGVKQQESWSFMFTQKGAWGYHDHMQASFTGKIIVQ